MAGLLKDHVRECNRISSMNRNNNNNNNNSSSSNNNNSSSNNNISRVAMKFDGGGSGYGEGKGTTTSSSSSSSQRLTPRRGKQDVLQGCHSIDVRTCAANKLFNFCFSKSVSENWARNRLSRS